MKTIQDIVRNIFKPNIAKIILFLIILFYFWGVVYNPLITHSTSHVPYLLTGPLLYTIPFDDILIFPYFYIIACFIVTLFNHIKNNKILLVVTVVGFILLLGIDEPVINATINRPNYVCTTDSDCAVISISKNLCGKPECINKNWKYYDSIVNNVFALSCITPRLSCSCEKNVCTSTLLPSTFNKSLEDVLKE